MHLLLAQKGSINESDEAIDLGQTPGGVLFLSAADTELASLADALKAAGDKAVGQSGPELRLANTMQLTHPMSIDVYASDMVAKAKLVIVRLLGGKAYWDYGVETLHAVAVENGVKLAFLPGDDKPDPVLQEYSTLPAEDCGRLWQYLLESGPQNAEAFLAFCNHLIGRGEAPQASVPLLKAGLWYPGDGICDLTAIRHHWKPGAPVVAINFYRALVQSGGLQPIEAMVAALTERGLNALPMFISSLKDAVSVETVRGVFAEAEPCVVLNTTGFAVSSPTGDHQGTVLDESGAVVLQMILAAGSKEAWQSSSQGLTSRDLAMNVALPEVDGRVLSRAIAFKKADEFDEQVQANIVRHVAEPDRVSFVADLAANWAKLRGTAHKACKVAIVLANYPNRDGRLGNGVGLDTPAGTINVMQALREAGYHLHDFPADGDALMTFLQEGPTNAGNDGRINRVRLDLDVYQRFFSRLPAEVRKQVEARWGEPETDPYFLDGSFALPIAEFGNVCIGIQPARGYNIVPTETYHSPDLVPPHGYLAFYAWLRDIYRSHAIIHMGKHGNLEWLPGKALALSQVCFPEAVLGPLPHLYPFIVNLSLIHI